MADQRLKIREQNLDAPKNARVVVPTGPIRARASEEFREHVDAILGDVGSLVVDFSEVEFIDSSTAGFLLSVHDRLREKGGAMALARLTPGVRVVIDSIGLTTFFTVCETIEEAVEQIKG